MRVRTRCSKRDRCFRCARGCCSAQRPLLLLLLQVKDSSTRVLFNAMFAGGEGGVQMRHLEGHAEMRSDGRNRSVHMLGGFHVFLCSMVNSILCTAVHKGTFSVRAVRAQQHNTARPATAHMEITSGPAGKLGAMPAAAGPAAEDPHGPERTGAAGAAAVDAHAAGAPAAAAAYAAAYAAYVDQLPDGYDLITIPLSVLHAASRRVEAKYSGSGVPLAERFPELAPWLHTAAPSSVAAAAPSRPTASQQLRQKHQQPGSPPQVLLPDGAGPGPSSVALTGGGGGRGRSSGMPPGAGNGSGYMGVLSGLQINSSILNGSMPLLNGGMHLPGGSLHMNGGSIGYGGALSHPASLHHPQASLSQQFSQPVSHHTSSHHQQQRPKKPKRKKLHRLPPLEGDGVSFQDASGLPFDVMAIVLQGQWTKELEDLLEEKQLVLPWSVLSKLRRRPGRPSKAYLQHLELSQAAAGVAVQQHEEDDEEGDLYPHEAQLYGGGATHAHGASAGSGDDAFDAD